MKIFLFLLMFAGTVAYSQSEGLQFESKMGDYGVVKFGTSAEYEFKFVNQSSEDITIKNIKSNKRSISYVVKDSIVKAGQKSSIKVIYKTDEVGPIRRTITVFTTGTPSVYTLSLRGRIVKS
jgi:hypothetical protein